MADKLLIVMANSDPDKPAGLTPPLFQATVAAAMEYTVELVLTGLAGKLAIRGVAEELRVKPDADKSIYDIMREAHEAGVKFKVCTPTLEIWGNDLIPEIAETVGGAYIVSEVMDEDTVTLTY